MADSPHKRSSDNYFRETDDVSCLIPWRVNTIRMRQSHVVLEESLSSYVESEISSSTNKITDCCVLPNYLHHKSAAVHQMKQGIKKPATLPKVTLYRGYYSRILNCKNGIKLCKSSHILPNSCCCLIKQMA